MKWIAKFLPSLVPGLTALLNPWVWGSVAVLVIASFLFGVHLESGRFEAFKVQVETVGQAQEQRAKERGETNRRLKKETDRDYKIKAGELRARNAALADCLQRGAGCGFVPSRQQPVGSVCPDGQVCYDAGEFDAALREFSSETARLVGEGETLKLKLDTAISWVAKQRSMK